MLKSMKDYRVSTGSYTHPNERPHRARVVVLALLVGWVSVRSATFSPDQAAPPSLASTLTQVATFRLAANIWAFPTDMKIRVTSSVPDDARHLLVERVVGLNRLMPASHLIMVAADFPTTSFNPEDEIVVSFGDASKFCPAAESALGCTTISAADTGRVLQASMVISPDAASSPELLAHVLTHELGHALGLDHRPNATTISVMGPSVPVNDPGLTTWGPADVVSLCILAHNAGLNCQTHGL